MWDGKILVLQRLKGQEFMSAAQLAGLWGVSEKTVRVRLKEMKPEIHRHGGELISKKGRGFLIRETDREAFEQWMGQLKAGEKHGIPDNPADRIEYLLAMFVRVQKHSHGRNAAGGGAA